METQNKSIIPKGAFSEMLSAFRYFDKVDDGCGYDRLNAKMRMIQMTYQLSDDDLCIVEKWAYDKYYQAK